MLSAAFQREASLDWLRDPSVAKNTLPQGDIFLDFAYSLLTLNTIINKTWLSQ